MMTGSEPQYREHLDKISSIIDKYDNTHSIIVTGDLNGSLIATRNNNHDKLLKEFCRKHHLNHTFENTRDSTFYHHNEERYRLIKEYIIEDQYHSNGSAHVPIRAKTNISIASDKIKGKKSKPKTILKWEETNIGSYQEAIETLQEQINTTDSITDIEEQAFNIINILSKASNTNVKKKIVSLKGPNWKASEKVKELISKSKNAFYSWKQNGRPKEQDNIVYTEMKNCKREARKQVRQEEHLDSQRFYNNMMNNPDSKTFHRLIRKNRAQSDNSATLMIKDTNGDDIVEQEKQTEIFAEFYETLATPATEEHFDSEYMEECEFRYNLINSIVHQSTINRNDITQFTEEEIKKAINELNTGKTEDGYSLTAEHFKYAGNTILPDIANLFNNIMLTGTIPDIFKTGILTPVHKKKKDPTLTTNYRGITVTSVLGKILNMHY
ncbi:Hypothetical predicted protein [Mytilus galloprovincialis]|uniref:Endonuclease/exonuclease/phosphatase domain-containing protein n=1 Tax=Mytilus galloprovincialis TaxID=29158 RepID=A0A8B6HRD4_MYTGA|nr:Hypothetical predicted protein [Mytilus galloprovincialis]